MLLPCLNGAEEFRKLLAAFVSGSASKSGGIIRKITPTSAELRDTTSMRRSPQKLQVSRLGGLAKLGAGCPCVSV